jgi:heme/copper-type cytochrome/quinol oxidase subunit 3
VATPAILDPGPVGGSPRAARQAEGNALVGMTLFIGSWAVLFAGLFFVYGAIRLRAPAWPPNGAPRLPLGAPAIGTVAIALASLFLESARARVRRSAPPMETALRILAAAALGAAFLGVQVAVWADLWRDGLRPESGLYASIFYALTAFHALHVAVALPALLWIAARTARGAYTSLTHVPLRLWALYLHMVAVLWGIMFVVVYLV